MSNDVRPFQPLYVHSNTNPAQQGAYIPSVTVAAGVAAVASAVLPPGAGGLNNSVQVQIANKTSAWAHVNFGVFGNVRAATLTDYPVAPGGVVVVTVDPEVTGASVITDSAPSGLTSVVFTRGSGT